MHGLLHCMITLATLGTATDYTKILPDNYESLTGRQKLSLLLAQTISESESSWRPGFLPLSPKATVGNAIGFADFLTTFRRESDVMPYGRGRLIHMRGTMAPVTFNGNPNSSFSGLYKQSGVPGLVRISLAGPPKIVGYTPGLALKLLADGAASANIIVMNSVNGQKKNANILENVFSNIVGDPEGLLLNSLGKRFNLTVTNPKILSVAPAARINRDGSTVLDADVRVPYQLFFLPTTHTQISPATKTDFRDNLRNLKPGIVLYSIFATAAPGGEKEWVGDLVLDQQFRASKFGDEGIFFRHESDFLRQFGF